MAGFKDTWTISAVGDICLSDHILCSGFGVASTIEKLGDDHIFRNAAPALAGSDIVFGNLECVLAGTGMDRDDYKTRLFRGRPRYADLLRRAGFNVLNVANNHTMQQGPDAFNETVNVLHENGIHPLGVSGKGRSPFSSVPVLFKKDNTCCGLLGYSFHKEQYCPGQELYAQGNTEDIKNDIAKLKEQADHIVVSCHWGLEMMQYPSIATMKLARKLIDFGADLLIGHHSHTLQGSEVYKSSLILYSLGNFVFDLHWDESTRKTGICKVALNDGAVDYQFSPYCIDSQYQLISSRGHGIEALNGHLGVGGDIEESNLSYYLMFHRIDRKLKYKKALFIMKNMFRIDAAVFLPFLKDKLFRF